MSNMPSQQLEQLKNRGLVAQHGKLSLTAESEDVNRKQTSAQL